MSRRSLQDRLEELWAHFDEATWTANHPGQTWNPVATKDDLVDLIEALLYRDPA